MGEIPKAKPDDTEKEKEHRSYYYDDAHGYEDYVDDDDDNDEDEVPDRSGVGTFEINDDVPPLALIESKDA